MHIRQPASAAIAIVAIVASLSHITFAQTAPAAAPPAITQGAGNIKRTPLQKFDVPGTNFETVIAIAEIVPDVLIGRHMHFGVESGYVLAGDAVLMVAGKPDLSLKVGDSYHIPANTPHDAKSGANGMKLIATYVVEKGKPFATPVP